jgi:ribosomal protein S18 acetylase RimI-like enzyme
MPVIQASEKYFMDVIFLLRRCIEDMNRRGMFHWNLSYPSPAIIEQDIKDRNLFIYLTNGVCQGMVVLNESVSEEYKNINWKTTKKNVLVVHRLAVNPIFQGQGIGRKLMEFAIQYAKERGHPAIWLDVIESNRSANDLYVKLNFAKTGSFHFPFQETPFICYELEL